MKSKLSTTRVQSEELGQFKLTENSTVKVARFIGNDGKPRIDIRLWVSSQKYTGPTKKGVTIPRDLLPELIRILSTIN